MLRNHGRRIAGSDLLCQPGLFFAFTGIAQELVDVELAGTGEHALPTYVSTEFVMQIMPKLGLKVVTSDGWFAARPSGTEDIYKIYAESFRSQSHLEAIVAEARHIVTDALAGEG